MRSRHPLVCTGFRVHTRAYACVCVLARTSAHTHTPVYTHMGALANSTRTHPRACACMRVHTQVLAFKREGYRFTDFSLRDVLEYSTFGGFWKVALKHWRPGLQEMSRSLSKARFVKSLQELVPEIQVEDVERHGAGVRAQAVRRDGALLHDFYLVEGSEGRSIHVLNAPSPAATASLSIAASLARTAARNFGWEFKEQAKK
eukprot:jgi/Chlat1/2668/Chrsp18S02978